ncbi:MAG: hypothetical protein AAB425_08145, partial [Bdellovibrionota bacterium]
YSSRLRAIGDWWVQLWSESLGKDGKGFTALAALGATDQHSILQLLRDGPDDKITWFITVEQRQDSVPIPKLSVRVGDDVPPTFKLLEGQSLESLLRVEYTATSRVLSQGNRPHISYQLDRLDERNLGALMFAFCAQTAITGACLGVNPFDQPGVQEAKNYIRTALEGGDNETDDENSPYARLRQYAKKSEHIPPGRSSDD